MRQKIPTGSEELLQVDGSNGGMSATVGVTLAVQRPPWQSPVAREKFPSNNFPTG